MHKIFLIRHTQVDIPTGTCYGITDIPLAPSFNSEASIIQKKIDPFYFNQVYSSPLTRCKRLAEWLTNGAFQTDKRLQEMNFGEWEGKLWDDIFNTPYGKKWMENYQKLPCPGGESFHELQTRVMNFISEMSCAGKSISGQNNVLIITHAGIIRVLLSILAGIPIDDTFQLTINYGDIIKIEKGEMTFLK